MSKDKVLFFLSGSISAYKACFVISRLMQDGCEVQTVATPSALKFVGAATLEGLTGKPVLSDLWEEGRAMDHIHLSRWADYGVLCPASANTIAKIATGVADDLPSALILGWPKNKPLHVFPAMNPMMLAAAPTQENLRRIAERGFTVHPTGKGNLACGEEGAGRLLEPEEILARLSSKTTGKVLITAGGTREQIDGIRYISNVSTGQTGAALADEFSARGWDVTYLHGIGARLPESRVRRLEFSDFKNLDAQLRDELRKEKYQVVVHAAAVSDYSVARVNNLPPSLELKLGSDSDLNLEFKRNFKILPRLKEYSVNKDIFVVGFKLTLNASADNLENAARGVLSEQVDAVVANDWSVVNSDRSKHPGVLFTRANSERFNDLAALSQLIQNITSGGGQ